MKIAISVPDATFEAAERASTRLGISRSQLYSRAVEEYIEPHRQREVREALATVYGSEPEEPDPVLDRLQAEALREEW